MRQILVKHIRRWTLQSLTPASADVKRGAIFAAFSFRKNCDAFYGQLDAIVMPD